MLGGVSVAEDWDKVHLFAFCSEVVLFLQELPAAVARAAGTGGFCRESIRVAKLAGKEIGEWSGVGLTVEC